MLWMFGAPISIAEAKEKLDVLRLSTSSQRIIGLADVSAAEVDDPSVAGVQLMPQGVLVQGKSAGKVVLSVHRSKGKELRYLVSVSVPIVDGVCGFLIPVREEMKRVVEPMYHVACVSTETVGELVGKVDDVEELLQVTRLTLKFPKVLVSKVQVSSSIAKGAAAHLQAMLSGPKGDSKVVMEGNTLRLLVNGVPDDEALRALVERALPASGSEP